MTVTVSETMVDQSLYPFRSQFLTVAGHRLHYINEGTGDPVIMLHGNPTWSFYYRNLAKDLRSNFNIIAPDHIGCGLSDKPGAADYQFTLSQRVSDLGQFIDHLDIDKKITLVLHDWGGMIGMAYAVNNPEKIGRLIISNTAAFHLPSEKRFPFVLRLFRDSPMNKVLALGLNAFAKGAAKFCCCRQPMSSAIRKAYLAPYNSWHNRRAILNFIRDIPLTEIDPSYAVVTETQNRLDQFKHTPTLILWGAKDFIFDDHFLEKWRSYLPQAEVHRFETAGHYLMEDAYDEVYPLITRFLTQNPI